MRALFSFSIFLFLLTNVLAQQAVYIDFSTPTNLIEIDTTNPNNVWQIGKPQKFFLDSAFSGDNAIITDTINPYPINDTSSFIFKMPQYLVNMAHDGFGGFFRFTFETTYQTDSLGDFGLIEFSPDSGNTWQRMLEDTSQGSTTSIGFYDQGGNWVWADYDCSIEKQQYGGQSDWMRITVEPCICSIPYPKRGGTADCNPNGLWFRFVFISDSNSNNMDGWMIDNISVDVIPFVGIENDEEKNVVLYPNPSSKNVIITIPVKGSKLITLRDILGNILYEELTTQNQLNLSVNELPSGTYYLSITTENNETYSKSLMVID